MDPESERDLADKRLRIYGHDEGPPPNGKKWWRETWGKAVGSVLGALLLGSLYYVGGKAIALHAATVEVYSLPPKVQELRLDVDALKTHPMDAKTFAQEVARELAKQQKGKP